MYDCHFGVQVTNFIVTKQILTLKSLIYLHFLAFTPNYDLQQVLFSMDFIILK